MLKSLKSGKCLTPLNIVGDVILLVVHSFAAFVSLTKYKVEWKVSMLIWLNLFYILYIYFNSSSLQRLLINNTSSGVNPIFDQSINAND